MRIGLVLLIAFLSFSMGAQQPLITFGAAHPARTSVGAPTQVHASDGTYDKFVLIRWEAPEKATRYRVFRATSPAGASLKELTTTWQNSTWFCDYSAEKGRDYYYAVMASDGQQSSPLSTFDKGFLRKDEKVAFDETLTAVEQERYAAPKIVFALVEQVSTRDLAYRPGDTALLEINLRNVFDEPTLRTELRIYLSTDAVWHFTDPILLSKTYSSLPAYARAELKEKCLLPASLLPGEYYLIVVATPEGDILNAKTGLLKIRLVD